MDNSKDYQSTIEAFDREAQRGGMFSRELTECDRLSLKYLNGKIKKFTKVLEIGCGMGNVIDNLKETRIEKHCIDISWEMLKYCQTANKTHGNMDNLPYEDNSFDLVYMIMTFQHSKDPKRTLSEMERVTKKGGRIIIIDGDKDSAIGQERELQIISGTWPMVGEARWLRASDFKDFEVTHLAPHILCMTK